MSINFMNYFEEKIAKEVSRELMLRMKILVSEADYVYCAGQCVEMFGDGYIDFYESEHAYRETCKLIEYIFTELQENESTGIGKAFWRLVADPGFSHYVADYLNIALAQEVTIVRGLSELLDGYETSVRTRLWRRCGLGLIAN